MMTALLGALIFAQAAPLISRDSGGSNQTPLGYGIVVNKESSLQREWIVVNSPSFPASIKTPAGIKTSYESKGSDYFYGTDLTLETKEELSAFEIRFLVFDVWGDHVRTLSFDEIADIPVGKKDFQPRWSLYSENEASAHYASIGWVARVRTRAGKVIDADPTPVLAEAKRFSKKFTASDLDPAKPTPK